MIKVAPPLLAELIERLKYLPPDAPLPELRVWSRSAKSEVEALPDEDANHLGGIQPLIVISRSAGRLRIRSEEAADWPEADLFRSRFTNPAHRWTQAARRVLYETLEGTPKKFRDYIWGDAAPKRKVNLRVQASDPGVDISTLWAATRRTVERYEDFRRLRGQMIGLARYVRGIPSWREQFKHSKRRGPTKLQRYVEELYPPQCPPADSYPIPLLGSLRFEVDNNGVMAAKSDEFSEAVTGRDAKGRPVDVRLIRECPNCQRIFWAGRFDNFVCSENCGLLLKARNGDPLWLSEKREQAKKSADKELSRLGFTADEIGAYQTEYGEHPRRVVYRYVERHYREKGSCALDISIPKDITEPLRIFLSRHQAA
ncbi:MAG: hypothetical protein QOE33_3526 [Acidobacteriota bacterium]|nr:hypothetical protein [Acidobacteriota bacterium]